MNLKLNRYILLYLFYVFMLVLLNEKANTDLKNILSPPGWKITQYCDLFPAL